jgi:hypothetical protein
VTMRARLHKCLAEFGHALGAFLRGFVGQTALPRESAAARAHLGHEAGRRGRCC